MSLIHLTLPDDLQQDVNTIRAREGNRPENEFLCDLIRDALRHRAQQHLEDLLREGMEGPLIVLDEAEWESLEAEAIRRLEGESIQP